MSTVRGVPRTLRTGDFAVSDLFNAPIASLGVRSAMRGDRKPIEVRRADRGVDTPTCKLSRRCELSKVASLTACSSYLHGKAQLIVPHFPSSKQGSRLVTQQAMQDWTRGE
jgi:hypothetical protein